MNCQMRIHCDFTAESVEDAVDKVKQLHQAILAADFGMDSRCISVIVDNAIWEVYEDGEVLIFDDEDTRRRVDRIRRADSL